MRLALPSAALFGLALAACSSPFEVFAPTEEQVVRSGWFKPSPRPALAPRYCYRTLAEVDCFAAPLPGAETRREGWFDAPVDPIGD